LYFSYILSDSSEGDLARTQIVDLHKFNIL